MSEKWTGITADEVFVMYYYGTYNDCEVAVMYGKEHQMTTDEQPIEVGGYTIILPSGSLELLLHKDSSFIDIRDAFDSGYLSEDDVQKIKYYAS